MSTRRSESDHGFTLVEALVALAVFAVAGVGLLQLQTQSIRTFSAVEQRTLAQIQVQNALVEAVAGRIPPQLGETEREAEFAGEKWTARTEVTVTQDSAVLRVSVILRKAKDGPVLARGHAFVISDSAGRGLVEAGR